MRQPPGFIVKGKEDLVCRLHKALYGLKQAGRAWNDELDRTLKECGYVRSTADACVYVRDMGDALAYLAIYVDDVLIVCRGMEVMRRVKGELTERYEMTDAGEIDFILGVKVERDRAHGTITINQRQYLLDVLERYRMSDCKPASTPFPAGYKPVKVMDEPTNDELKEMDDKPYINLVGSLMYAMVATRPDLAFAVGALGKFSAKPRLQHWNAAKHVLRYVKATLDFNLTFGANEMRELHGFCDADWAGDIDTRRSTTGYVFLMDGGAVSWSSKRQPTVALSTTEAEYMSATQATKEACWLRKLLADLGRKPEQATFIQCDSQGAIALIGNPVQHTRTKHIDIQHHFVREQVEAGAVKFSYCPTETMIADVLTKGLPHSIHYRLLSGLGFYRLEKFSPSGSVGVVK
jgi:Reverse transcriptase (RNA-dependent DNA polymerase)